MGAFCYVPDRRNRRVCGDGFDLGHDVARNQGLARIDSAGDAAPDFALFLAGLALYAVALALRIDLRKNAPPWHLIAVLAVTMFGLNYALTYLAETHLASGLVAVLFGTMPFFIFGFAHALIGERANRATIVGALLAFAGVATISLVGNARGDLLYVIAALVASASSGFANVYLKRFAASEPFVTLPPAMLLAGVGLTASGLAFEHLDAARAISPISLIALAYLALVRQRARILSESLALAEDHFRCDGPLGPHHSGDRRRVGALAGGEDLNARDGFGALLVSRASGSRSDARFRRCGLPAQALPDRRSPWQVRSETSP